MLKKTLMPALGNSSLTWARESDNLPQAIVEVAARRIVERS